MQPDASLRRVVADTWTLPDVVVGNELVRYTRHHGSALEVPFTDILTMNRGLACRNLVFVDASRLYTR